MSANYNAYPTNYGGSYPGGTPDEWSEFGSVYPKYQQLMWNNNASANAAMNKVGGAGASRGTPYSSALGQLAMQGASGLQSLFSQYPSGGSAPAAPAAPTKPAPNPTGQAAPAQPWLYGNYAQTNDPSSPYYHDQGGYESYLNNQKQNNLNASNPLISQGETALTLQNISGQNDPNNALANAKYNAALTGAKNAGEQGTLDTMNLNTAINNQPTNGMDPAAYALYQTQQKTAQTGANTALGQAQHPGMHWDPYRQMWVQDTTPGLGGPPVGST